MSATKTKTPAGHRRLVLAVLREIKGDLGRTVMRWNWTLKWDRDRYGRPDPATVRESWQRLAADARKAASSLTSLADYADHLAANTPAAPAPEPMSVEQSTLAPTNINTTEETR